MNACGHCEKACARLHCAGCRESPDIDGNPQATIVYCSKQCQTTHRATHREECNTLKWRRELFRAGSFLKKMWNAIRRESFDNYLVAAEESAGTLILHEGNYKTGPTLRHNGFYRKFPNHIFKDEKDEDAALNTLYCYEAVAQMFPIVKWLLADLPEAISETTVSVNNPVRKCRYTGPDPAQDTTYSHKIYCVFLRSKEVYAMDFSGAQYGFYEPVVEWNKYMQNCEESRSSFVFGDLHGKLYGYAFRKHLRDETVTDMQRTITVTAELLRRIFEAGFHEQISSRYTRSYDLLKLSRSAFEAEEKEMIALAQDITKDATEKLDAVLALTIVLTRNTSRNLRRHSIHGEVAKTELEAVIVAMIDIIYKEWERDENGVLVSVALKRLLAGLGP